MKTSARYLFVLCLLFSTQAFATTGEKWEITSTTEMVGMPVPPQTTTSTVCVDPKEASDPHNTMPKDQDCTVSNVKTSGQKTSWSVRCNQERMVMKGTGEITNSSGSYAGKMQMSGKMEGQSFSMKQLIRGKRLGTGCTIQGHRRGN